VSERRWPGPVIAIGLVFVVIGVTGLLDQLGLVTLDNRYLAPLLLIVVGAALLLGGSRRRGRGAAPPPDAPGPSA
jgi:hypothetical protein